jgi:hypothetical protein
MNVTITIKDYPCGSGKTTGMIRDFKEDEKYLVILPELTEVDRIIHQSKHVKFVEPTTEDNNWNRSEIWSGSAVGCQS